MWVIAESCWSLAPIVCCTDGRSDPLTWRFSVFGKLSATPAQRVSSEMLPSSWTTHRALPPPSSAIRAPALWPARFSSEPKNIRAP